MQPSKTAFSREDFLAFFNDHKNINLLTTDEKTEIASRLIEKDNNLIHSLLQKLMGYDDFSFQQILQESNSLPVF